MSVVGFPVGTRRFSRSKEKSFKGKCKEDLEITEMI
jgi:hypothetical protein